MRNSGKMQILQQNTVLKQKKTQQSGYKEVPQLFIINTYGGLNTHSKGLMFTIYFC